MLGHRVTIFFYPRLCEVGNALSPVSAATLLFNFELVGHGMEWNGSPSPLAVR